MNNCYAVKSDSKAKEVSVCRTRRSVESIVGGESAFNGKKRQQVEEKKGGVGLMITGERNTAQIFFFPGHSRCRKGDITMRCASQHGFVLSKAARPFTTRLVKSQGAITTSFPKKHKIWAREIGRNLETQYRQGMMNFLGQANSLFQWFCPLAYD